MYQEIRVYKFNCQKLSYLSCATKNSKLAFSLNPFHNTKLTYFIT